MRTLVLAVLLTCGVASALAQQRSSDAEVSQAIIQESIEDYRRKTGGNCPCPYNRIRNGRRCGKTSAYVREGGESPLCFRDDVSQQMIDEYRASHGQ